jgi:hypothetical protein
MKPLISDYVKVYKNFLTESFCKDTVDYIGKSEIWKKHSYSDGSGEHVTQYDNDLSVLFGDYSNFSLEIMQRLWHGLQNYMIECNLPWHQTWQGYSHLRYNKYDPETEMRFHCDHITTLFDGTRKGIPVLTLLGLLNDEFEGGELVLFDQDNEVNFKSGDLIIFPSNFLYPHAIKPIKSGVRYSFVSWSW